jgi:hypothetical protein
MVPLLWCALDSAPGNVPNWGESARAKIKAVVSLSGVTDPSDWSHPDLDDYTDFERDVDRYVHLPYNPVPTYDYATLRAAAPIKLILDDGMTNSPPVFLVASQ